jgi:prolyl-tRNA editing enzyme YbaK/EbsC (Cys-tRNA(Pro) deacylase)
MAVSDVKTYLEQYGLADRVIEFDVSSATVDLAALAVGVEPARIAKTLSFLNRDGERCILIVTAGDARIDNTKFKAQFEFKARMLDPWQVVSFTGHTVGGVCPFAIQNPELVDVYLDESMKRFDTIYPAAGSGNSAVRLTCEELFSSSRAKQWVDVCKDWQL